MNALIKKVRVTQVIEETPDSRTFVLEGLEGWNPVYAPGQFLTLVFNTPFGEKRRSYSISSTPAVHEPFGITVKRVTNGEFSRQLVDKTREGDTWSTSGISGFFQLPVSMEKTEQFFFLAAGSGITPCFSLIKTLLHTTGKKVILIYSNRSQADTIFYRQLKQLQEQFPNRFTCHFLFSNHTNVLQARLSNWLLTQLMESYLEVPPVEALFYLCGPFSYMQAVTITLLVNGVPAENIKKENFDTSPRKVHPVPPDINPHQVTVHFHQQQYTLHVQYPHTILQVAKSQGIQLPYSCEAGRCGSCIATCTSGKTWMAYNEVLTDAEINQGRVLVCQAYPIDGDATISF